MSCDRAHDGIKIAAHLAAHTAHGGHQKTAPPHTPCHAVWPSAVTNSAGESDRAVDTDSITRARAAQELSATQKTEER